MLLLLTGCDFGVKAGLDEETRRVLNDAISMLQRQPMLWEQTLNSTINELGDVGGELSGKIAKDITGVLDDARQNFHATFNCEVDIIGMRVAQAMMEVRYQYIENAPAPVYSPLVCVADPGIPVIGETQVVTYSGFNFLKNKDKFNAGVRHPASGGYASGMMRLSVTVESQYTVRVRLSGDDSTISWDLSPELVLTWGSGESELPLIKARSSMAGSAAATTWVGSLSLGTEQCQWGYVLQGLKCIGTYCKTKSLLCMKYHDSYDPKAKFHSSTTFSEEGSGHAWTQSGFVTGIGCDGEYCDNVHLQFVDSVNLKNTGSCFNTPHFSEEGTGVQTCASGYLVSGISCYGGWCSELSLRCCQYSLP